MLVSGGGTGLQAIIEASEANRIDATVAFVGSDNREAYGLKRAEEHGIPRFVVDYPGIMSQARIGPIEKLLPEDFDLEEVLAKQRISTKPADRARLEEYFSTRAVAEAALLKEMDAYKFDLLALAGFMRIVTPYFIDRVNTDRSRPRIMNIHPALLPAFPGNDGYGDTYRYGCKVAGCTVHFVDYGEDTGPIVGQKALEIAPGDTIDTIRQKGLRLEWQLYPECIQLYAEGRLKVVSKRYTLPGGREEERKVVVITP